LLPTKGLPLPFVSMGGSSLLASMILCALVQSVAGASEK
jgi:cell division protein FtsW (lipid II flippase)